MSQANDVWYVRFPDGRVVRAPSTEAVRHHLDSGRIPHTSRVRRSPEEEWVTLEWTPEFADLLAQEPAPSRAAAPPPAREAAPLWEPLSPEPAAPSRPAPDDRMQLETVGARGMVDQLCNALDSTLARLKLRVACLAGVLGAVLLTLLRLAPVYLEEPWPPLLALATGFVLLLIGSVCTALLAQMTFVELSRTRSARWADATAALGRNAARLVLANLVVLGSLGLAIWVLVRLPGSLPLDWPEEVREALGGVAIVLVLILVVLLGPVALFAQLFGPLVIVEELPAGQALGQWWQFVRRHRSRLFLYEALTAALAVLASLPLLVPVALVAVPLGTAIPLESAGVWGVVIEVTVGVLTGVALAPAIAYLAVANVFIYLNVRYEQRSRRP